MIFVELSGHELYTEWRRPKLKNKIFALWSIQTYRVAEKDTQTS